MNRKSLWAAAAFLVGAATAPATPITFQDNNPADVYLNFLNPSYTGTFDIAEPGYDPTHYIITSAVATFSFFDLLGRESFTVNFGPNPFLVGSSFVWDIDLGGNVTGNALLDLSSDGILSYTVARGSGEFWLTNANLTVEADDIARVPDEAATALLLGIGFLGLAWRRRVAKAERLKSDSQTQRTEGRRASRRSDNVSAFADPSEMQRSTLNS